MLLSLKFEIISKYRTQANFAKKLGRNDNWISRIVTGRQIPNKKEKEMIANLLQIENIDNFLSDSKEDF